MPEQPDNEALWRALLTGEMEVMRKNRRLYRRIPSAPRCKACNIPFRGIGGPFIGPQHPAVAVRAARDLLVAAPEVEPGEKLPIGVGVHTGTALVGSVGFGDTAGPADERGTVRDFPLLVTR